ncbi:MAG: sigma-54-dependent Fis family transcriptional regulator [bacterium]|nr:sigma-54-dependent Fis family transcriptional regulator [bacterium]
MSVQRILVVDDDALSREFLVEAVHSLGYNAVCAANAEEGLQRVEQDQPDMVISDMRMPGMDGIELAEQIRERWPDLPVVLITAHGTVETAVKAIRDGVQDFLLKPCSPDAIGLVIERVSRTKRLEQENAYLRDEVSGTGSAPMVAESRAMLELLRSAARISRSCGTVLITGESGTGKERVAQYIHQASPRASGPFIRVNCAALSEQLLESELFGHERGAFTGAHKMRSGRFELADGGTLLLDELGEISSKMQAKLLRVLQEDEFERVGGQKTLRVDVRVIASTNRNLAAEVAEGRFREDLYYRLHVLPLHVAPLREREEDILPLARHFTDIYARRNGLTPPAMGDEAIERLLDWTWPGNVRELENVVQRAVILGNEGCIRPEDLVFGPAMSIESATPTKAAQDLKLHDPEFALALADNPMSEIERVAILATLESTRGNKTEAARRLGLTARTLSNKMKIWRQAGLVA